MTDGQELLPKLRQSESDRLQRLAEEAAQISRWHLQFPDDHESHERDRRRLEQIGEESERIMNQAFKRAKTGDPWTSVPMSGLKEDEVSQA